MCIFRSEVNRHSYWFNRPFSWGIRSIRRFYFTFKCPVLSFPQFLLVTEEQMEYIHDSSEHWAGKKKKDNLPADFYFFTFYVDLSYCCSSNSSGNKLGSLIDFHSVQYVFIFLLLGAMLFVPFSSFGLQQYFGLKITFRQMMRFHQWMQFSAGSFDVLYGPTQPLRIWKNIQLVIARYRLIHQQHITADKSRIALIAVIVIFDLSVSNSNGWINMIACINVM